MQIQSNKLDFTGQNIYSGIDTHKKQWTVTVMVENIPYKTFSQPSNPDTLFHFLKKNFPGGTYYSAFMTFLKSLPIHYHLLNVLYYHASQSQGDFINIAPLNVTMEPDSVVTADIHLLEEIKVGLNERSKGTPSLFKVYPNPSGGLLLNYKIDMLLTFVNCFIELVDVNGQIIGRYSVTRNQGQVSLPAAIKHGIYTVILYDTGNLLSVSRIVVTPSGIQ
jgi:hypothetical protein